jgi:hypothetical protein
MNIINTEELEKLLVSNWTAFLQPREILKFANEQVKNINVDSPINNLSISRFELKSNGFLLWVEFNSTISQQKINGTIEAFLTTAGELQPIRTII